MADFGTTILQTYKLGHGEDGESFDIATIPVRQPGVGKYKSNQIGHWLNEKALEKSRSRPVGNKYMQRGSNSPANLHNTHTLILNVTSPRTRVLLDRYHYDYLYHQT